MNVPLMEQLELIRKSWEEAKAILKSTVQNADGFLPEPEKN